MSEYKPKHMPESVLDVFLHPGEFYWGKENTRIRTLLGSCVSIVVWHPNEHIGGMSHYMLPEGRGQKNPKFGDTVVEMILAEIAKNNIKPKEYLAKVFGGGHMFSKLNNKFKHGHVGQANVDAAFSHLNAAGFKIVASDTGGVRYRKLIFDLWSGDVWMQKQETAPEWVDPDPDSI
ncbi:MAG: chemotaxis protein CheD [Leptonema sp. (in: Bacteria)]|nr:chemotaxis protein CheD [Leptonema sp. (in: bacteria)]